MPRPRETLLSLIGSTSLAAAVLILAFVLVATREPTLLGRIVITTTTTTNNSTVALLLASNTTAVSLVDECLHQCGGGACEQSALTGIVSRCLSCGLPGQVGETCMVPPACTTKPFCTTVESLTRVLPVHNALVRAALEFFGSNSTIYPAYGGTPTDIQASSQYSVLTGQGVNSTYSITLLNLFLPAKVALLSIPSSANPSPWFDDQGGWWSTSLDAYETAVDIYLPYVTSLKRVLCANTWQLQNVTCVKPL